MLSVTVGVCESECNELVACSFIVAWLGLECKPMVQAGVQGRKASGAWWRGGGASWEGVGLQFCSLCLGRDGFPLPVP
jgi:hypothetical protein